MQDMERALLLREILQDGRQIGEGNEALCLQTGCSFFYKSVLSEMTHSADATIFRFELLGACERAGDDA